MAPFASTISTKWGSVNPGVRVRERCTMPLKADLKKRSWPRTALVTRPNCWKWSRMASTGKQSGTADTLTAVTESPGAQPYTRGRLKGDAKEQGGRVWEDALDLGGLTSEILEEKIISLFHGKICLDRAKINEDGILIESWDMVERGLVDRAGRRVREASSEAASTAAKRISIRSHFPQKDRRKMTIMKVVFEDSAVESPNSVMGYTQEKIAHKCTV
jgi:hypothetical protein